MTEQQFSIRAIDMKNFSSAEFSPVILRLMWAMNEISQLSHLSRMIDSFEEEQSYCWKYCEGLRSSLLRQRSAIATEILHTVVRPLVADDAESRYPSLYKLIQRNKDLKKLRGRLRTLFYGKYKRMFDVQRQIRHRITNHFDHKSSYEVLPDALNQTVRDRKRSKQLPFIGYVLQGISEQNEAISRFILVDEVISTAWRKNILGIGLSRTGFEKHTKVVKTRKFMLYYMKLFHEFSNNLIDEYFFENSLWVETFDPADLVRSPTDSRK